MNEGNVNMALENVRILDLCEDKGLYTGKLLADLGADVIKVEEPGGSRARRIGPFKNDIPDIETSLYFINFNTNKRGITLNLQSPAGQDIFRQLVKTTDILIEDFDPGGLNSMGLEYPILRELNRRIILASITGFGLDGPCSNYKASDIVNFAMGGLMYTSGSPDEPPVVAPCEQAYHSSSIIATYSIIAALYQRLTTNEGQVVDVSAHEVMSICNEELIMRYSVGADIEGRYGSQHTNAPGRIYACKDGHVYIAALPINQWLKLFELLGSPEIVSDEAWYDPRFRRLNVDIIDPIITEFTMKYSKKELTEMCQSRRIPCTPVNTPADIAEDIHIKERNYIKEIEHPVIGRHKYPGPPYKLSETPCRIQRPAPLLGQHNQEIYCGELGFTDDDLIKFKSEGSI